MSTILFAQPVFLPDEKRLQRNIDSLSSFYQYMKNQPESIGQNGLVLAIGGWAKTDDLWSRFCSFVKTIFDGKLNVLRFDKNYGKAIVVNTLIKKIQEQNIKFDYIFTMDSDIIFIQEQRNMFVRLLYSAHKLSSVKKMPFGMISMNQSGQNCHLPHVYENSVDFTVTINNIVYTEKLVWPTNPSGMAGGCLFISKDYWCKVGGYKVFGVYAGDDAHLLLDCGRMGFSYQMFHTLSILHPMDNDEEYARWKVQACQGDTRTGLKQNIDSSIKNADDFWDKR
jgi:hypothetical protein